MSYKDALEAAFPVLGSTVTLYHGGKNPSQDLVQHKKGRAEVGPGLYLTTSWTTANTYSKGSRALWAVEIKANPVWSNSKRLPGPVILEFIDSLGRKGRESYSYAERSIDRQGGSVPAEVLINLMVNANLSYGRPGLALQNFLIDQGVEATHYSKSMETWVIVHDPRIIQSTRKVPSSEVGKGEFLFDLPFNYRC